MEIISYEKSYKVTKCKFRTMQKPKSFLFRYKFLLPPKKYTREEKNLRESNSFGFSDLKHHRSLLRPVSFPYLKSSPRSKIKSTNGIIPRLSFPFVSPLWCSFHSSERRTALRNVIYRNLFALNNLRLASFLSTYTYTEELLHNPFAFRSFR